MNKYIHSLFLISILSFGSCAKAQNTNSEQQIMEMLKVFYTEYNLEWLRREIPFDEGKLDSLVDQYCTLNVINEVKKQIEIIQT